MFRDCSSSVGTPNFGKDFGEYLLWATLILQLLKSDVLSCYEFLKSNVGVPPVISSMPLEIIY